MASITTFFGTQGGGGSVSGTATRVAFFGGTPGSPSTTLDDSANLEWDDTNSRLSVGDATTVASTLTIAGAGSTDSSSAFEVRTDASHADLLLFRVYDNGRIDSRMLNSSEALTGNLAIGVNAGNSMTTGTYNSLYGESAGAAMTVGSNNTASGSNSSSLLTTGSNNSSFGSFSLYQIATGAQNSAFGYGSFFYLQGDSSRNTAVGSSAGAFRGGGASTLSTASRSIYIGDSSRASVNNVENEIVIGCDAIGGGSNTVTIGDAAVTNTFIRGNLRLTDPADIVIGGATGTKIGTAASQKLSLWGKTPIVQPTTAGGSATVASPGAGSVIKTDDTFDGYTLAQVVRALRDIGVLQ